MHRRAGHARNHRAACARVLHCAPAAICCVGVLRRALSWNPQRFHEPIREQPECLG